MNVQSMTEDGSYQFPENTQLKNFSEFYTKRLNNLIQTCHFYKGLKPLKDKTCADWAYIDLHSVKYRLCNVIDPSQIDLDINNGIIRFVNFLEEILDQKPWQMVWDPEIQFSFDYREYEGSLIMKTQILIITDLEI